MPEHKSQFKVPLWLNLIGIVFCVFIITIFGVLGWYTILTTKNIDIFSFLLFAAIATAALWYCGNGLVDMFKEDEDGIVKVLIIAALFVGLFYAANNIQNRTPRVSEPRNYYESKGYECTDDCSGHDAGYEWAADSGVCDEDYSESNSNSFDEGVRVYAEENC